MHSREVQRTQVQRGLELVNKGATYKDASIAVRGNVSLIPSIERARRAAATKQLAYVNRVTITNGYELCDVCGHVIENEEYCSRLTLVQGYSKYAHEPCLVDEIPALWKKAMSLPSTLSLLDYLQRESQAEELPEDDETDHGVGN